MITRAVGVLGFGFVGDRLLLAGVGPPPVEHAGLARDLARWDLLLWSPFFLLWDLLDGDGMGAGGARFGPPTGTGLVLVKPACTGDVPMRHAGP